MRRRSLTAPPRTSQALVTAVNSAPADSPGQVALVDPHQASVLARTTDAPHEQLVLPAWGRFAGAAAAITISGATCAWIAAAAHPSPLTHAAGLFLHLACLVLGFGAVLAVDWVAFLWVIGRRRVADVLTTARTTAVPVWAGYAGLVLTGIVLEPDISIPRTQIKLAAVLIIGLNGAFASWLHAALQRNDESARLLVVGTVSALISQASWWTATLVGFLNAR